MTTENDDWDELYERLAQASNAIEQNTKKLESQSLERVVSSALSRLERDLKSQINHLMRDALGALFQGGGKDGVGQVLSAFLPRLAKGGVVDGATSFAIGGEAGPEAVLPLKRMADGRLGVAVEGATRSAPPPPPQINLTLNTTPQQASHFTSAQVSPDDLAELVARAIEDAVDTRLEEQRRDGGVFRRLGEHL